jgi:hypothetical protein
MKFASLQIAALLLLPPVAAVAADDDYREQRLALAAQPGYVAGVYQARQSALIRKAEAALTVLRNRRITRRAEGRSQAACRAPASPDAIDRCSS